MVYSSNGTIEIEGDGLDILTETAALMSAVYRSMCEELGDVMLQIVLNAQIGTEDGAFTIDDVIQGISEKMIRRHPWVFGDVEVDSIDENVSLWEEIKKREKATE